MRRLVVIVSVFLAPLVAVACREAALTAPRGVEGRLALVAPLPPIVQELVVEVSGPGINPSLFVNLPANGDTVVSGTLSVPAGAGRLLSVRAVDSAGIITHRADTVVTIAAGQNPPLRLQLTPQLGGVGVVVGFGSVRVILEGARDSLLVGETIQFNASAYDARGWRLPDSVVTWASGNPALFTVTAGRVSGIRAGTARLAVRYNGVAAGRQLRVLQLPGLREAGQ